MTPVFMKMKHSLKFRFLQNFRQQILKMFQNMELNGIYVYLRRGVLGTTRRRR